MKLAFRSWIWLLCIAAMPSDENRLRADDEVPLFPVGPRVTSAANALGYVTQAVVRDDLKLTDDQQQRIDQVRDDVQAAAQNVDVRDPRAVSAEKAAGSKIAKAALIEILTPDQCRRHWQIVLQQILDSGRGLIGLIYLKELADVIQLDADQREQIETIRVETSQAALTLMRTNRGERVGLVSNPDLRIFQSQLRELTEDENRRIAAVLSTDQKKRLLEALGSPLVGRLSPVVFTEQHLPPPQPANFGNRRPSWYSFPQMRRNTASFGPVAGLGGAALSESPLNAALLALDEIREELRIAPERVQQDVLLGGDAPELLRCVKKLPEWLEPAQIARLRQLSLQVSLLRNGPAAVFEFREVVETLQLDEEQRTSMAQLVQRELNSNRQELVLAIEPDPGRRRGLEKELADRLDGLLTADQRHRLSGMLGDPHRGSLSLTAIERALQPRMSMRARTTTELGRQPLNDPRFMTMAPIHDELKLSDEQRRVVGYGRIFARDRDKLNEILSAGQRKRYNEIVLQAEARRDGPAAVFRYQLVMDELTPNEEQRRRLLELIQEDTRAYLRIPREKLAETLNDLDTATSAKLEAVLTDAQREKLARLLGEPADCLDQRPRPPRLP